MSLSFKMSLATNTYAYMKWTFCRLLSLVMQEKKRFFILSLFFQRVSKKKGLTRFHIDIVYLKNPYYISSTAGMGHLTKGEEFMYLVIM